ncbi:MAG: TraB/GumN family protein [Sphingomonadaceae bacterium]
MWRLAALFLLAWLPAGCWQAPEQEAADPAIWEVTAPGGQKGWLFGTVHALERPALWRTKAVGDALEQARLLYVEVADLDDGAKLAKTFAELSASDGLPPLSARVDPAMRQTLRSVLERHGLSDAGFANVDTWAAALTFAQAAAPRLETEYGIDRALLATANDEGLQIAELEGAAGQLAIFDSLPEAEQADLLESVAKDAASLSGESTDLVTAWRTGDMAAIERETTRGLLADPELRAALFTDRNAAWTTRIAEAITQGRKPFVAVGAAHMAGTEGLPAMLEAQGFGVNRLR